MCIYIYIYDYVYFIYTIYASTRDIYNIYTNHLYFILIG